MRDAASAIRELVGDLDTRQIETDSIRRAALLWHFTVLGEAASQISDATRDAEAVIAWRGATRMRNRIVDGYWDIDIDTLVATAADDQPTMVTELERLIDSLSERDAEI